MTKITFIGVGYVGLVSGACLAELGNQVTCYDIDSDKIAKLNNNIMPIYEPGLKELVARNKENANLKFTDKIDDSFQHNEAVFIAVGTPTEPETGKADLSYVFQAAEKIAPFLNDNCLIIIKSTVPPGSSQKLAAFLQSKGYNFAIASNPEFLREGFAIDDFLKPDRIVVGAHEEKSINLLKSIYQKLIEQNYKFVATNPATAELIKYSANSFLATKICFINEMADICEKIDGDINKLSEGIGLDSRIGTKFLQPGPGFGGSCFPKDILALTKLAAEINEDCSIVNQVIAANEKRYQRMVDKISLLLDQQLKNKKIAAFGLTFKANTDDIRCSPAIEILQKLASEGAKIHAYDPEGQNNAASNYSEFNYGSAYQIVEEADILLILTEWSEFKEFDYQKIANLMQQKIIFDMRNILDRKKLSALGFKYNMIGKK